MDVALFQFVTNIDFDFENNLGPDHVPGLLMCQLEQLNIVEYRDSARFATHNLKNPNIQ